MKQAIQSLKARSVPFTSPTAAIRRVKDLTETHTKALFEKEISDLVEAPVVLNGFGQAKYTYLYLVAGLVDAVAKKSKVSMTDLFSASESKAADFIKRNPWLKIFDPEANVVEPSSGNGELHGSFATKVKRGKKRVAGKSKLELARDSYNRNSQLKGKALLEVVAKDVGTSVKGANSLVYLVRKELKAKK